MIHFCELIVVEFCGTIDATGHYRKYAAATVLPVKRRGRIGKALRPAREYFMSRGDGMFRLVGRMALRKG